MKINLLEENQNNNEEIDELLVLNSYIGSDEDNDFYDGNDNEFSDIIDDNEDNVFEESCNLKENANSIAVFISNELKSLEDQGFATVLRNIIFSSDIDWNYASKVIHKFMPEVVLDEDLQIVDDTNECEELEENI